jgi:anti-sigma factor RsiW
MSVRSGNEGLIRSYLLGDLSEQEREQVERRLMSDDDLYQQLLLAEDDLIDEYAAGTLSDRDRAKFSRRFLSVPELRQDVKSVMALRGHALRNAPRASARDSPARARVSLLDRLRKFFMRPAVGVAFAAASLAAVLVAVWLGAQNSRLRQQVEQLQARQVPTPATQPDSGEQLAAERLRNEQLLAQLQRQQELLAEESRKLQEAREQPQPSPKGRPAPPSGVPAFVALALTPGAVRDSGEWQKFSLSQAGREVRVSLDLAENNYQSYSAAVQTVEGREVFSRRGLRASRGSPVRLNVATSLLSPGDYKIELSGTSPAGASEKIDSYYFRVLK